MSRSSIGSRIEEKMRLASYRATERIARRAGTRLGMYIGCGYPKSGTVWLCRLMSTYANVPHPQQYLFPIAMRAVVHAHWDYHAGLPPTAYIYRDGRDVMVSLYYHQMRQLTTPRNPRRAQRLLRRYQTLFGPSFDARQAIADVRGHLPLFIDAEFRDPVMGTSWSQHVHDWMREPRPNVVPISYEALKADTEAALSDVMTRLIGEPADPRLVTLSVARHEFELASGRQPGQEVRQEFLRKGVVGDWRSHFTLEASDVFERHAGAELVQLGYETDSSWVGASERED